MNVPNALTVSRFFLIPVCVVCFFFVSKQVALLVMLLAGLTDVLDGYIARKLRQTSTTGELLDPLADKALLVVVSTMLIIDYSIHWIVGLLVCLREICMVTVSFIGRARGLRPVPANQLGKWITVLYYALFSTLMLELLSPYTANFLMLGLLSISLLASVRYAQLMFTEHTKRHIRG